MNRELSTDPWGTSDLTNSLIQYYSLTAFMQVISKQA